MLERRKKTWAELTRTERRLVAAGVVAQIALQVAALWDLRRRSADELRGRKAWWTVASFVNVLGPLAYFAVGRRCGRAVRDRVRQSVTVLDEVIDEVRSRM